jgi:hypothetical protein
VKGFIKNENRFYIVTFWEGRVREGKGREGKGREGKGREGKGREGKGREGKGREGKRREGNDLDADPGGPKTYGSYGPRSGTLLSTVPFLS